jgi:HAMP domain-containing protein
MKNFSGLYYPSWSIACRIAAAMMLAVIVPMVISAYFNLQQITTISTDSEYRQLELLASTAAQRFDRLLLERQRLAIDIANRPNIQDFWADPKSVESVSTQLTDIVTSHPDLEAILLLDQSGHCVTSTMRQFVGHTYTLPDTTFFSQLHSNVRDYPGMFVSQSSGSQDSWPKGLVLLKLRGVEIWSVVNQGLLPKTAGQFFLVDNQGTIISHPHLSLLYQKLLPIANNSSESLSMLIAKNSGHFEYQPSPARMPQIIGFATLASQPWLLGVSQSAAEFQAPLLNITWLNLQGVMGVGGIAAVVAASIGMYISRPIQALTIAARTLEQGDDDLFDRVHQDLAQFTEPADDLGQLVRAFLQMTNELHRRDRQLKTQVQFLRIEVDRTRRDQEVAEITDSDGFQLLQQKIQQMRNHEQQVATTEDDYFQQLQNQVQSLKNMGRSDGFSPS